MQYPKVYGKYDIEYRQISECRVCIWQRAAIELPGAQNNPTMGYSPFGLQVDSCMAIEASRMAGTSLTLAYLSKLGWEEQNKIEVQCQLKKLQFF